MARHEWFRHTSWSETDQLEFLAHLRRCRSASSKAQYLRIQALHLQETGAQALIMAALGLLDQVLGEYPAKTELASVYLQRGECLMVLGKGEEAIESLRKSLEFQRDFPFARNEAHLVFGELVVRLGRRDLYSEVLATLGDFGDLDDLPIQQYRKSVVRASILDELGRREEAREAAAAALQASGQTKSPFRNHPRIGLVGSPDPAVQERLAAIAARGERA
jgi:tetratricopeptide (TPR) repeat protein